MQRRSPPSDALTQLILEVFRLNGDLLAAGDDLTRDLGQTSARWQVLGAMEGGPQTVAGIARAMGLARQSVQRTADLLAREGLVEYADNPAHRRAKLAQLTGEGRRTLARITARQAAWADRLASGAALDEPRIRDSVEVLKALRHELER